MKTIDKVGKEFWENSWEESPISNYTGFEKYLAINKKLDRLFKEFLEKGNDKILEIGCAKGKQLIYFAKEFGYDVHGIDYSEKGVKLARANLKMAGVSGEILYQDLFMPYYKEEAFDIVYSMGLIEHFDNPAEVIDIHLKLLKKHGFLIITMPNFKDSLYLALSKLLGKDKQLLETHNLDVMDKKTLSQLLQDRGIKILMLDYFGPIDFTSIFSSIKGKPILYLAHLLNQLIGYATFFMPSLQYFSPYLVLIAQKITI